MESPNIVTPVTINKHKVTYEIVAYREVTEQEAKAAILSFLQDNPKPSPGQTVRVLTVFGHSD